MKNQKEHKPLPADAGEFSLARLAKLDKSTSGEYTQDVANDIRSTMQKHAGVFRTSELLKEGVEQMAGLAARVENIHLKDKSKVFNTARVEALELENLIEVARATMVSAEARKESRGAHAPATTNTATTRTGCATRWYSEGDRLDYKPVQMKPLTVESVPPKPRTF